MAAAIVVIASFLLGIGILFVKIAVLVIFLAGNMWFTDSGVLRELQIDHPEIQNLRKTERHPWDYSKIRVMNDDGTESCYYLDTNILFNYEFRKIAGPPC